MSGSFWKLSNGFTSLSNVVTILENYNMAKDDAKPSAAETLIKLFDESDLLQELMSNNSALLEFLRQDSVIALLVDLLILESLTGDELEVSLKNLSLNLEPRAPSSDDDSPSDPKDPSDAASNTSDTSEEKPNANENEDPEETFDEKRTRYATLAAEILSADVWSLTDTVMESTENLNKLWSVLDFAPPLSINLATYFMKIMEHLLDMKCEEMVTYLIDNQPNLVQKFIKHLSNPPLMDFLLKLISTDKPDNSTGIIDFLQEQHLIAKLVNALATTEASVNDQDKSVEYEDEEPHEKPAPHESDGTNIETSETNDKKAPNASDELGSSESPKITAENDTKSEADHVSETAVSEKLGAEVLKTIKDPDAKDPESTEKSEAKRPDVESVTKAESSLLPSDVKSNTNSESQSEALESNKGGNLKLDDFSPSDMELARQSSAADFLKALITISANSTTDNSTIGPNELTRELVSYEMMSELCNIMLKGGYALGNGVGIIIEIIRKNNSDYDILPVLYITLESHLPTGRDAIYLGHLVKVFGSRISDFNKFLSHSDPKAKLKTTFGEIEPLGFERFKICELIAELLHCSNMALLNDNKGFDVVRIRDELRKKMKEFDPVGFKYNEIIDMPQKDLEPSFVAEREIAEKFELETKKLREKANESHKDGEEDFNDTVELFNANVQDGSRGDGEAGLDEEEEVHANANLTEEQMRQNPVVGDYLKIQLFDTQIITNILSMFFKFPWNNFLHNVVFDIVQQVLNGSMDIGFNKFLAIDIFHSGNITIRITEGQKLCTEYEQSNGGLRLGYMGHLTLIAEEVVKFIQLYPVGTVSELINEKIEDDSWGDYVSRVLFDTRKKYNAILGGSDADDEEGSNTFDESTGEIIEEGDLDSHMNLDPTIDHDLIGNAYEDHGKEEEYTEDVDEEKPKTGSIRFSSDESESDDEDEDDHFASYMSLQLNNSGSSGFMASLNHKAKEFTEGDSHKTKDYMLFDDDDDDDDYIDPNDDGMSYKKAHPLYDSRGMLVSEHLHDKSLSDNTSSSSDSDDDDLRADDLVEEQSNKLTRAASKG